MAEPEHKTIAEGFEAAIQSLNENNPTAVSIRDVGGKLQVLEFHVQLRGSRISRRRHCVIQMIINPWAWPKQCPTIDILGVEWSNPPSGVRLVNEAEGRYTITHKGSTLRDVWTENPSLSRLQITAAEWLGKHQGNIKVRTGHPLKNMQGFGLLYPGGMRLYLDALDGRAEGNNWLLLNREAEVREKKMAEEKLKIEVIKAEAAILKANSEDELDAIDLSLFDGEQLAALQDMLEQNREKFSWSHDDIIVPKDDPIVDSGYRRKSRRIADS